MILFVYCCKKSHKSIIEVSFFADFWLFSLSQFSALSFLYQILIPSEKRLWIKCVMFANFRPNLIKLLTFNDEPICFFRK